MGSLFYLFRTCGIIVCFIFSVQATEISKPWIFSVEVKEKYCYENVCKYFLNVDGGVLSSLSWRLTPKEGPRGCCCDVLYPNYEINEVESSESNTKINVSVPYENGKIFFCLRHSQEENSPLSGHWIHLGEELYLEPQSDFVAQKKLSKVSDETNKAKHSNLEQATTEWGDLSNDTDVNDLPNAARPARHELDKIEVLRGTRYVPLNVLKDNEDRDNSIKGYKNKGHNNANDINARKARSAENDAETEDSNRDNSIRAYRNKGHSNANEINARKARSVENDAETEDSNPSDDLITKQQIVRAKMDVENNVPKAKADEIGEDALVRPRRLRQVEDPTVAAGSGPSVKVEGIRVEDSEKDPKVIDGGIPSVLSDSWVTLRLFGEGLTTRTVIAFTYDSLEYGMPCKFLVKGEYLAKEDSVTPKSALFEVRIPKAPSDSKLYICAKNLRVGVTNLFSDEDKYFHQGSDTFEMLAIYNKLLPLWASIMLILICLTFSALFSGLNLGLMSLDRTELKIISNTGTEQERKYARAIMPVRDHGNYLLCSILLGNVAVNSTFTILLDDLTSGLFAVIFSTLAIVLLGEITPQAICSRHGLMVGARSIMVTKVVMALTAPLAFPVSKLLDFFLGEEIGSVYNRERLKELVKVTTEMNDLDRDEVNIISGALELRKKTVSDVMTKLEDVFMLPTHSVLDFETMSEIIKSGYSRVPVYEGSRTNIVTVLFIKDLAFVDPDDNTPLRTLCQYYQNACNFVFEDVTLDVMFKQFKEGHKGHMAFVHRINNEGEGDPFYETIGLVTLEDVIEEMIQAEIVDETDVFMDNRTKRRRNRPANKLNDFAAFAERHENQRIHISPQLTLATFQFLSTSVDAFRPDTVSETVLRRLLKQDVIQYIKIKGKTKKDACTFVYHQGKPVDYFVLILEGRVEVTVGRENLVFEAGPFTYFGVQALTQNVGVAESPTPSAKGSLQNINMDSMLRHTFVPDYSVRAITELYYLTVKRSLYLAAKRATLMEKGALSKGSTNEQFDNEVDKHLLSHPSHMSMVRRLSAPPGPTTAVVPQVDSDDVGTTSVDKDKLSQQRNTIELTQVSTVIGPVESQRSECQMRPVELTMPYQEIAQRSFTDHRMHVHSSDDGHNVDANNCSECRRNNFLMQRASSLMSLTQENTKQSETEKRKAKFISDGAFQSHHPSSESPKHLTDSSTGSETDGRNTTPLRRRNAVYLEEVFDDQRNSNYHQTSAFCDPSRGELKRIVPDERMLLQSVDEDLSYSGDHKTPSRQVSPNIVPVSASPITRASFAAMDGRPEEQEKLLASPL